MIIPSSICVFTNCCIKGRSDHCRFPLNIKSILLPSITVVPLCPPELIVLMPALLSVLSFGSSRYKTFPFHFQSLSISSSVLPQYANALSVRSVLWTKSSGFASFLIFVLLFHLCPYSIFRLVLLHGRKKPEITPGEYKLEEEKGKNE